MKRWVTVTAGLVLAAAPALAAPEASPAASDVRPRVAIIPGVAVNLDAARVDALAAELADALAAVLDVDALGGLEVRRRLPADGLPPDCVASPACAADVARRLDANQLLFVVMVDTGGDGAIQIDSTWVEPATGRSASRPAIDIAVLAEARTRFIAAARQILPDAPLRPAPATGLAIDGSVTAPVPRHFATASYVTAGAAIVGLGVGIGFGLRTRRLYADCDRPAAPCDGNDDDRIRTSALIADLGWVTAIGSAVATAVLYATSGSETRLVVAPAREGGGVTLGAVGRF